MSPELSPLDRCELIIVAYRSRAPIEGLFAILSKQLPVIVVDNSAQSELLRDLVERRPKTRYIDSGGNPGFAAACNIGAAMATQPNLIFLNPDCRPTPESLLALATELEREPRTGSCGPGLVNDSGVVQRGGGGWQPTIRRSIVHACALDRLFRNAGIWIKAQPDQVFDAEWIAGTCLVIRRDVFLEVGGFDERYFLYQEDMDLGRRLHDRGYRQIFRGDLRVAHAGGGSSPSEHLERLWKLRGRALCLYLGATHGLLMSATIRTILGAGYLLRGVLFALARDQRRAREMWTYSRMLRHRSPPSVAI